MTGAELKTIFEELIDDNVSDDLFFAMLENADQELRDERDWAFLRAKTTIARVSSDVYTTAHSLPANFDRVRLQDDAVRSDSRVYHPIDFDEQETYKDAEGYYYLAYDDATGLWKIYFTGTGVTDTVYVLYQKRGTEITADNDDTQESIWPGKRAMVLPWLVASRVTGGIDGDEINFRMSPEQKNTFRELKQALVSWDTKFKLRAMGGRTRMRHERRPLGENQIDLHYPYRS